MRREESYFLGRGTYRVRLDFVLEELGLELGVVAPGLGTAPGLGGELLVEVPRAPGGVGGAFLLFVVPVLD